MGNYERTWYFSSSQPRIGSPAEMSSLPNPALEQEKAGNTTRAQTCIHHALLLRKCSELEVRQRALFFKGMSDNKSGTFLEVFANIKEAYANIQKVAKGPNPPNRNPEPHLQPRIETY